MKKKKCHSCNIIKPLFDYPVDKNLKSGYRGRCKDCSNNQCKIYYMNHRDNILNYRKEYNSLDQTKKKNRIYAKHKRDSDINYRIKDNLRRRINYAIKFGNKTHNTNKLLGCSVEYFKEHIESLWEIGMSWKNYGKFGWHLDHIKPCVSFDLTDPEQQKKCFHYSNLQPLWAKDNWSKGSR